MHDCQRGALFLAEYDDLLTDARIW